MNFKVDGEVKNAGYEYEMPNSDAIIEQYYYLKPTIGRVIVHHYEQGTENELVEDEIFESIIGDTFTVTNLSEETNKIIIGGVEDTSERNYLLAPIYQYISVSSDIAVGENDDITGEFVEEDVVITYYYSAVKRNVNGGVLNGTITEGEVTTTIGTISDINENVIIGQNSTKDIKLTPIYGYRVKKVVVYSGDEATTAKANTEQNIVTEGGEIYFERNGGIITVKETEDGTALYEETDASEYDSENGESWNSIALVGTLNKFTNIEENKYVVVEFEERPFVAQIVAVPSGTESTESVIYSGRTVLNEKYYTLKDAIRDAYEANKNSTDENKIVEIKILEDIANEHVTIKDDNNISLELDKHTINSSSAEDPTIKIMDAGLIVKDNSIEETGKIISSNHVGIYVTVDGSLTLGIKERPVSQVTPTVEGVQYGVYKEKRTELNEETNEEEEIQGIFNFYDGLVIGKKAIYGKIDDQPEPYDPNVSEVNGKEVAKLQVVNNIEAVIGKQRYTQVEIAFIDANEASKNGTPVEIDMTSDATTENAIEIMAGRNIKLDLNGYTITSQATSDIFTNNGTFTIDDATNYYPETGENKIQLYGEDCDTYYFNVDDKGKITSNNQNKANTRADGYIVLDLTDKTGDVDITVNAEISSQAGYDIGYARIDTDRLIGDHNENETNERFIYISGEMEAEDYTITVEGGRKYFLHFGYYKNGNTDEGTDTFTINSVKVDGVELKIGNLLGGTVEKNGGSGSVITNNEGATYVHNSGKISSVVAGNTSAVVNNGTMTFNGGGILTTSTYSKGMQTNKGATTTINGGYVSSGTANQENYSFDNYGTMEINEGRFNKAIRNQNDDGVLELNGGFFPSVVYNNNADTEKTSITINNGDIYEIYNNSNGKVLFNNTNAKEYTTVRNSTGTVDIKDGNYKQLVNTTSDKGTINMEKGEICNKTESPILNHGSMTIQNSTITGSTIWLGGYNGFYATVAVLNYMWGVTNIDSCTVNGHILTWPDDASGWGWAGKYDGVESKVNIYGNTIINSTSSMSGQAIRNNGTVNIYGNTIINHAGNYSNGAMYNETESAITVYGNVKITGEANTLIYNKKGTINLKEGTFISNGTTGWAIYNETANTITNIGTKNEGENTEVSITNPTIKSNYSGISVPTGATFSFYDGQIIVPVDSEYGTVSGLINNIEEEDGDGNKIGLCLSIIEEEGIQKQRLTLQQTNSVARISKSAIGVDVTSLTGKYTDDGAYYNFNTLQDAINACSTTAGANTTNIEVMKTIMTMDTLEVVEGQNIKLDINGHKVSFFKNETEIVNNGTLELADSSEGKVGEINAPDVLLNNIGTAIINVNVNDSSKVGGTRTGTKPDSILINNSGALTVNGGKITGYFQTLINNSGNLTVNGGELYGKIENGSINGSCDSWVISNIENAKCLITGGKLSSDSDEYNAGAGLSVCIDSRDNSTLKIIGGEIRGANQAIHNYSTAMYEEGVSDPALWITGGTISVNNSRYGTSIVGSRDYKNEVWILQEEGTELNVQNTMTVSGKLKVENSMFNTAIINENGISNNIKNSTIKGAFSSTITSGYSGESTDTIENSTVNGITKASLGTMTIIGTTVSGTASNTGEGTLNITDESIVNGSVGNGSGTTTIENSTVNSGKGGVASNGNGTLTMIDSTINASVQNTGTGDVYILGQTVVEASGDYDKEQAIRNTSTGTVTIGVKSDGIVSEEYPKIETVFSNGYGVKNENVNGTINFYDGIIIGKIVNGEKKIFYRTPNDIEPEYDIIITENASELTASAVLKKLAMVKILKTDIQAVNLAGIEHTSLDENYYGFFKISDAVNACTDNQQTTMIQVRDIAIIATTPTTTIPSGKNIVWDINGYNISSGNNEAYINNGTLKIIDSSEDNSSTITISAGKFITNNGTLEIGQDGENDEDKVGIKIVDNAVGSESEYTCIIKNAGELTINNCDINISSASYINIIENDETGNVETKGGKFYSTKCADDAKRVIVNRGTAQMVGTQLDFVRTKNYENGTIEYVDLMLKGTIDNYGESFVATEGKPAIKLKGVEYTTNEYNYTSYGNAYYYQYNLNNYAGEVVIENSDAIENMKMNACTDNDNKQGRINNIATEETQLLNRKITINSGRLDVKIVNNNGIIEINGGTIGDAVRNISNTVDGTINFYGGTIKKATITNYGTFNMGNKADAVNTDSPIIDNSGAPTLTISNYATFNFYDGKIKTGTTPIYNIISDISDNSSIICTQETIDSTTVDIYSVTTDSVAEVNGIGYVTIDSAFNKANELGTATIKLLESVVVADGHTQTINSGSNITLNLNGKNITACTTGWLFTNNGTFSIIDSTNSGNCTVKCYSDGIISNTGNLTIETGMYTLEGYNRARIMINNSGTITISGGTFVVNDDGARVVYSTSNAGAITITGGRYSIRPYHIAGNGMIIQVDNEDADNKTVVNISGETTTFNATSAYGEHLAALSCAIHTKNADVTISGGTIEKGHVILTNSTVTMTGGTITRGNVDLVNSTATMTGGTITEGTITIDKDSEIEISGTASPQHITNNGILTMTAGNVTGNLNSTKTATVTGGNLKYVGSSGTLTLKNAEINNTGVGIGISNGTATIENVSAQATDTGINVTKGTVTIKDTTVTTSGAYGIATSGGTTQIIATPGATKQTTIESTNANGTGLYINGGTVTLGENVKPVDRQLPLIKGTVYGVNNNRGTFNYYDGRLIGTSTNAMLGNPPADMPNLYTPATSESGTIAWLEIQATSGNIASINATGATYTSLQLAINNSSNGEISLNENIVIAQPLVIANGINAVIDLQGNDIEYNGDDEVNKATFIIEEGGSLTIKDGNEDGTSTVNYGIIRNYGGPAIINNGTFTLGVNDGTAYSNSPRVVGSTYAVVNKTYEDGGETKNRTFNFYDGVLKGITDAVSGVITAHEAGYDVSDGTEVENAGRENEQTFKTKFLTNP